MFNMYLSYLQIVKFMIFNYGYYGLISIDIPRKLTLCSGNIPCVLEIFCVRYINNIYAFKIFYT